MSHTRNIRRFSAERPGVDNNGVRVFSSLFTERPGLTPHITEVPPPRAGLQSYRLNLESVLPSDEMALIKKNKAMCFHCVGDTGNGGYPSYQDINTEVMESDFGNSSRKITPSFFYHLGDIVYQYGEPDKYYEQFYHPYMDYPKSILAIPGNHDGMPASNDPKDSLKGFIENFCVDQPHNISKDARGIPREAMTEPYVYWTLETPYTTIIGLYSNTDEFDGHIDEDQAKWFIDELHSSPQDKALIVAIHHPPYSLDRQQGQHQKSFKGFGQSIY